EILKMEDRIEFARRMHEMVLARIALEHSKKKSDFDYSKEIEVEPEGFEYEKFWNKEEKKKFEKEEEKRDEEEYKRALLLGDLKKAAHRINLEPKLEYECERLIKGEREGFKEDFKAWLSNLLSGAIPKVWSDELVKFLMKAKDEI
ncbi:hypothetical protein KY336_04820, partial [Candidatus Woesearchaeota archaeon]|nr:hypothetical protein [Candidatus Woesearchaeota archaeon]